MFGEGCYYGALIPAAAKCVLMTSRGVETAAAAKGLACSRRIQVYTEVGAEPVTFAALFPLFIPDAFVFTTFLSFSPFSRFFPHKPGSCVRWSWVPSLGGALGSRWDQR